MRYFCDNITLFNKILSLFCQNCKFVFLQRKTEAAKPLYTWQYTLGDVSNIGICYLLYAHGVETVISEEYAEVAWIDRFEFADYIDNINLLNDIERAAL